MPEIIEGVILVVMGLLVISWISGVIYGYEKARATFNTTQRNMKKEVVGFGFDSNGEYGPLFKEDSNAS